VSLQKANNWFEALESNRDGGFGFSNSLVEPARQKWREALISLGS
jgi:hypothetical protein